MPTRVKITINDDSAGRAALDALYEGASQPLCLAAGSAYYGDCGLQRPTQPSYYCELCRQPPVAGWSGPHARCAPSGLCGA